MTADQFDEAVRTMKSASFEDSKLQQAKLIVKNNCLTVEQVRTLIRLFSFEQTKLAFAKYAYDKSHYRKNFYLVNQDLTFDSSKTEMIRYMGGE